MNPKSCILVVEDDFDIRDTVALILESEGYTVLGAANGLEALELLRRDGAPTPALILLDLMMPVMNGWQFRVEQQQDPKLASIPVVVVSADAGAHQKAASIDAAGFLKKPVQLDTLLEMIARFVRPAR